MKCLKQCKVPETIIHFDIQKQFYLLIFLTHFNAYIYDFSKLIYYEPYSSITSNKSLKNQCYKVRGNYCKRIDY